MKIFFDDRFPAKPSIVSRDIISKGSLGGPSFDKRPYFRPILVLFLKQVSHFSQICLVILLMFGI